MDEYFEIEKEFFIKIILKIYVIIIVILFWHIIWHHQMTNPNLIELLSRKWKILSS